MKQASILKRISGTLQQVARLNQVQVRTKSSAVEDLSLTDEFTSARPYEEMPGPAPLPLLGNNWRFMPFIGNYSIEHIDQVCQQLHRQYGRIVKLAGLLGRPDMVFLFDADDIERVFRSEELMPHRPSMPSLNYYKHVLRKDFFGEDAGVIAVHGEQWYRFRTRVQQPMLQPRTAKLYVTPIEQTAQAFIDRIRTIRDSSMEMPDDFLNEIHKWSLESIAQVALDTRLGCLDDCSPETQSLIDAVNTFFHNVGVLELKVPFWRLFNTPTWRKYIGALDTITSITMKHISAALERLQQGKGGECTAQSSLLERVLTQEPDNPRLACILAMDMFLVGIDTTSAAVASILYQLSQHPEKQEILHNEVSQVLTSGEPLTSQRLDQMSYLRAVIKETLRMYPVVIGNGRCMTKDSVIAGYQIPKGTQIVFQHYVISNSEEYFSEPHKFIPERWLKCSREQHHPFASLPFGYGRRMCLGRRFAELEIQTLVAKMVQAFKMEYHYDKLSYSIHPMYMPDGPLRFKMVDR
ncbi:probable cytochrome P450 49a1 [Macrosteles quadrilineatus]|uniref:probable cytochrome P450 49a1 n=1 Tax=Macrosteles quadrilineatus TaxID=74068 RepID=UPI0023E2A43F|nr:probable cytochrome P450 49a1 [Macrosteles quadrilineatus]